MKLIIVTGVSGAGKSTAVNFLEDNGYFCIDNIPPEILPNLANFMSSSENTEKVAIAVDIRSGDMISGFGEILSSLKQKPHIETKVLFIDADDDALVRRYKETRRRHPLDEEASGDLIGAIALERQKMQVAKNVADYYVNSTTTTTSQFKELLSGILSDGESKMTVDIISFGFKHGSPKDADLVFDVRCLPNPFYIPELKFKTGLDNEVYNFVMDSKEAEELYTRLYSLITYLLPLYVKEGKSRVVIAFGCTGGKHRSISFARRISEDLEKLGWEVRTEHRHIKY
ncbi:MAG: RNase adapter RapZ [Oscillospiraceae bacterium]|nr:RNase adapter RapZ [Oscillospiraceae bacterium]